MGYCLPDRGTSHGAILTAQNFAVQAMCKPGDEGAAATMYTFIPQFSIVLGVGVGSTAFQNVMKTRLRDYGLPTEIAENAEAYMPTLHSVLSATPHMTPTRRDSKPCSRFGLESR